MNSRRFSADEGDTLAGSTHLGLIVVNSLVLGGQTVGKKYPSTHIGGAVPPEIWPVPAELLTENKKGQERSEVAAK